MPASNEGRVRSDGFSKHAQRFALERIRVIRGWALMVRASVILGNLVGSANVNKCLIEVTF